jgi:E3 ubiquitin-protein ligase HUWE1
LAARPSIIPALFSIFTSEKHLRILSEKESAGVYGASIDELIRHHPSLKALVFDAIIAVISKMETLGEAFVPPSDIAHWYTIRAVQLSVPEDVVMEDVSGETTNEDTPSNSAAVHSEDTSNEDNASKSHDNVIVHAVDILGRVC